MVTPGEGVGLGAVTRRVLDELHNRLRAQCMDITRTENVDFGRELGVHTFALDPPSAGLLTVTLTGAASGSRSVAFGLTGIAAVTLAGPLRALARDLQEQDPRLTVGVFRTERPHRADAAGQPYQRGGVAGRRVAP